MPLKIVSDCLTSDNSWIIIDDKKFRGVTNFTFDLSADKLIPKCSMNFFVFPKEKEELGLNSLLIDWKNVLVIESFDNSSNTFIYLNGILLKYIKKVHINLVLNEKPKIIIWKLEQQKDDKQNEDFIKEYSIEELPQYIK